MTPECSLIVPIYRNAENIPALIDRCASLNQTVPGGIELICVVDGSPDNSHSLLSAALSKQPFPSKLLLLSRNFGSFAAIREGLATAGGSFFAVMAADLQEPSELLESFFSCLRNEPFDLAVGTRESRTDGLGVRVTSNVFWRLYRRFVQPGLPKGGIDVFACNEVFRDQLLCLSEANSSLVGQLIWLGFRQKRIPYHRAARQSGKSAWTFRRKLSYFFDSAFSFSDLPVRVFIGLGFLGLLVAALLGLLVILAKFTGRIVVPGYTATVLTILFFSSLNLFGLGIIGSYVWRAYENTKARPLAVVMQTQEFPESES
jgi:glycosyltransferase involved in cell wall biosynthesis